LRDGRARPRGLGQPVHCTSIQPGPDVAVKVHRHLNRRVPELFLDVQHRLTSEQQERGVGVSQIVDSDRPHARLAECLVPDLEAEERGVHWLGVVGRCREHPGRQRPARHHGFGLTDAEAPVESLHEVSRYIHTPRLAALWCAYDHATLAVCYGPVHFQIVAVEIQVTPLEPARLAHAQPRPGEREQNVRVLREVR